MCKQSKPPSRPITEYINATPEWLTKKAKEDRKKEQEANNYVDKDVVEFASRLAVIGWFDPDEPYPPDKSDNTPTSYSATKHRSRCMIYKYRDEHNLIPKWQYECYDHFSDIIPSHAWGYRARYALYLGMPDKKGGKRPIRRREQHPHRITRYNNRIKKGSEIIGNYVMPLPYEAFAHLAGATVIYYMSNYTDLCIDIDDHEGLNPTGRDKLIDLVKSIFPTGCVYDEPSLSKKGHHIYYKVRADQAAGAKDHIDAFYTVLHKAGEYVNGTNATVAETGDIVEKAKIDSAICGGPDQLVNIPFFREGQKQWEQYNSLRPLSVSEIDEMTVAIIKWFPEIKDVIRRIPPYIAEELFPEEAKAIKAETSREKAEMWINSRVPRTPAVIPPKPPELSQTSSQPSQPGQPEQPSQPPSKYASLLELYANIPIIKRTFPRRSKNRFKLLEYADHSLYSDRWEARTMAAWCAGSVYGMTLEEFVEFYNKFISLSHKDDEAAARAYRLREKDFGKHSVNFESSGYFEFDPQIIKKIRWHVHGLDESVSGNILIAVSALLYSLSYSTNTSDGGLSRKGYLEACEHAHETGVIEYRITRTTWERALKICKDLGLISVKEEYVRPRLAQRTINGVHRPVILQGKARTYNVAAEIIELFNNEQDNRANLRGVVQTDVGCDIDAGRHDFATLTVASTSLKERDEIEQEEQERLETAENSPP